ncbi:hypothetical protein JQ557_23715 [Bradyrhizobium sp. U87765 SZCCT0131]|uniref:hypothetical protein n=1 Tax=unclassified Bradyrhizobium TaxID=2631580 RepID=UPI001BAD2CCD|nr:MULTISPECIES: hypothetical protein [unclassified Bradyrhizobium]MBR1221026.1 hypothetical protein [Bradyrhizobium sp. U87765 SZCCT0131]MBR1260154.1 hypothetical protein [Bradyrhizobium sp. U87765 SZCCT0134]MBR1307597.1 hypothetical protein [Bradyrhizobium sp. U87765 SZCCT0110]MBR1321551.1 hypothetical protein [Bradyrhizobium sp. U87765 SZCCT0109]MBR1349864.1 hypothetical protein [Bradyrhizobium sp. U87765 SZCCT0048]
MKRLIGAIAILTMLSAPALARHRTHPMHHHHHHGHHAHVRHAYDRIGMNYLHNYGRGPEPGTAATYDGPLNAWCKQSASAYRGQDGRPHPCN